jgi:hypothetical protein
MGKRAAQAEFVALRLHQLSSGTVRPLKRKSVLASTVGRMALLSGGQQSIWTFLTVSDEAAGKARARAAEDIFFLEHPASTSGAPSCKQSTHATFLPEKDIALRMPLPNDLSDYSIEVEHEPCVGRVVDGTVSRRQSVGPLRSPFEADCVELRRPPNHSAYDRHHRRKESRAAPLLVLTQ